MLVTIFLAYISHYEHFRACADGKEQERYQARDCNTLAGSCHQCCTNSWFNWVCGEVVYYLYLLYLSKRMWRHPCQNVSDDKMGTPVCRGGFLLDICLKMLINAETPLIDLCQPTPVDCVHHNIDVLVFPIWHPHPADLCRVCRSIEPCLLRYIDVVIKD